MNTGTTPNPAVPVEALDSTVQACLRVADHAVRELLLGRCDAVAQASPAAPLYHDCRALLNAHEYSGATIDLHNEVLRYAHARNLIRSHPHRAHLVRIAPPTPPTP